MPHKTFISYKYSESKAIRDGIINAFCEEAIYYNGEIAAPKNITVLKRKTIGKNFTNFELCKFL